MITGNEPASPCQSDTHGIQHRGLTIRQHFASTAMQGMIATKLELTESQIMCALGLPNDSYDYMIHLPKYIAKRSLIYADALIAELNTNV
jgi:hypothetical protein